MLLTVRTATTATTSSSSSSTYSQQHYKFRGVLCSIMGFVIVLCTHYQLRMLAVWWHEHVTSYMPGTTYYLIVNNTEDL